MAKAPEVACGINTFALVCSKQRIMVLYTYATPDDLSDAWHEEVNGFCHAGILGVGLHVEGFQRRRQVC